MKILTIAATPFFSDRGCHVRIYNKAKYLEKLGAKVKICTYFSGESVADLDVEKIKKVGWYKRTAPGFSWGKFWLDIKLIFLCRRAIKTFRPDVIHAHMHEGLGVGYIAKILAFQNLPIVTDLQADLDDEFRNYNEKHIVARWIFVWLSKRIINRCDWLMISSENLFPKMEKMYKRKKEITVVRDGVDMDLFENVAKLTDDEQKKIEEIKKWKGNNKLLVYIGGLSDNKGVKYLLESFKEFAAGSKEWKLLVGGFGKDEKKYKEFVEQNNLGRWVCLIGKVKYLSLPSYLALADAAIDPKDGSTESSGKLVNLMAAGLPIICRDNDFNRSRLGDLGLYIAENNDFKKVLDNFTSGSNIDYGLKNHGEALEAKKLLEIINFLIHERQS
jgi:glycosyltransferase involved in cell wall biosynthesis